MPAKALNCHSLLNVRVDTSRSIQWSRITHAEQLLQEAGEEIRIGSCGHGQSLVNKMRKLSQLLISLHEALACFQSLRTSRSASYLNNMKQVFGRSIIVCVREDYYKKINKILPQFHDTTASLSMGHGSIRRISPQMGLQACMKKGGKGVCKHERRNI